MTVVTIAEPEVPDAFAAGAELLVMHPSHGHKSPSTVSQPASIRPVPDFRPHQKSPEFQRFLPSVAYYGYRWLDPATGRWPSRDVIEEEGGVNLYGLVGNDGVNKWDYLGMDTGSCSLSEIKKRKYSSVNWIEDFAKSRKLTFASLHVGKLKWKCQECQCKGGSAENMRYDWVTIKNGKETIYGEQALMPTINDNLILTNTVARDAVLKKECEIYTS